MGSEYFLYLQSLAAGQSSTKWDAEALASTALFFRWLFMQGTSQREGRVLTGLTSRRERGDLEIKEPKAASNHSLKTCCKISSQSLQTGNSPSLPDNGETDSVLTSEVLEEIVLGVQGMCRMV